MNENSRNTSQGWGIYIPYICLWALIYIILGYISLSLDDPKSRVAMVWFPSGAAVSAYISLPEKVWKYLYGVFFIMQTTLDVLMRHEMLTSVILTTIALTGEIVIAWSIRFFGKLKSDFDRVYIWLFSTFLISAVTAFFGVTWLNYVYNINYYDSVILWWSANVSGTIVATTILTGITWDKISKNNKTIISAVIGITLLIITTFVIFSIPPGPKEKAGFIFLFSCVPILITIVITLIAGIQTGAVAFLLQCIIVIYLSMKGNGPFFINGLFHGEPLLLAQFYLSGTALLMLFIRLQLRQHLNKNQLSYQNESRNISFRMDFSTGFFEWESKNDDGLRKITSHLNCREDLLLSVSDFVKDELNARWEYTLLNKENNKDFVFEITLRNNVKYVVWEKYLLYIPDDKKGSLIIYWSLMPGSHFLNNDKG
ncbi:MASE1 domain-containing protein [Klebsiella pneumoniae]